MTLAGEKETRTCKMITKRRLQSVFKSKCCQLTQFFSIVVVEEGPSKAMHGELHLIISTHQGKLDQVQPLHLINELLIEFRDLFLEPTTFPLPEYWTMQLISNPM